MLRDGRTKPDDMSQEEWDAWWAQNGDDVERIEAEGTVRCLGPATDDVVNQVLAELQDEIRSKEEEIEKLRQERDAPTSQVRCMAPCMTHIETPLEQQLMSIESPLRNMIAYVVNHLRKYGITPIEAHTYAVGIYLENGILQQTFEFKEEVSGDDQDLVTRALENAGWDTEWFREGYVRPNGFQILSHTLTVSYNGYSFYEESFRHAQKLCNQSA